MQNEICPFAHGVYCKEDCKLFNRDTKECKLGEKKSDGQFVSIWRMITWH
jgi:ribosomal protein L27